MTDSSTATILIVQETAPADSDVSRDVPADFIGVTMKRAEASRPSSSEPNSLCPVILPRGIQKCLTPFVLSSRAFDLDGAYYEVKCVIVSIFNAFG